jgi:hypothetical protein
LLTQLISLNETPLPLCSGEALIGPLKIKQFPRPEGGDPQVTTQSQLDAISDSQPEAAKRYQKSGARAIFLCTVMNQF